MILQVEKGNCDNLFFIDIESYFTSNLRLYAVRNVGKKYVEEVQSKSRVEKDAPNTIVSQPDWHKVFSPGELQIIFVWRIQLANTDYFLPDGNADPAKMRTLIREIEIGLWDNYLFWEYESYQNIRAQHNLANIIQNALMGQQMMGITSLTTIYFNFHNVLSFYHQTREYSNNTQDNVLFIFSHLSKLKDRKYPINFPNIFRTFSIFYSITSI